MQELTAKNCPFEPVGDHLIVRRLKKEKTQGGILLPDSQKDQRGIAARGMVIAVGPGKLQDDGERSPMDFKPGESVIFTSMAGLELGEDFRHEAAEHDIKIEDIKSILLMRTADIVSKVKQNGKK